MLIILALENAAGCRDQLGPTVQELEEVIVEGEEIQSIQDVQRNELRETNRWSREIRRRGRSLRNKPRLPKPRRRLTPDEKTSSWKRSSRR